MPCPRPDDLLHPGIEPASLTSPALAGGLFTTSATWETLRGGQYLPTGTKGHRCLGVNPQRLPRNASPACPRPRRLLTKSWEEHAGLSAGEAWPSSAPAPEAWEAPSLISRALWPQADSGGNSCPSSLRTNPARGQYKLIPYRLIHSSQLMIQAHYGPSARGSTGDAGKAEDGRLPAAKAAG